MSGDVYELARVNAERIRDELRVQLGRATTRREQKALALLADAASRALLVDGSFRIALMRRASRELVRAVQERALDERQLAVRDAVRSIAAVVGVVELAEREAVGERQVKEVLR